MEELGGGRLVVGLAVLLAEADAPGVELQVGDHQADRATTARAGLQDDPDDQHVEVGVVAAAGEDGLPQLFELLRGIGPSLDWDPGLHGELGGEIASHAGEVVAEGQLVEGGGDVAEVLDG